MVLHVFVLLLQLLYRHPFFYTNQHFPITFLPYPKHQSTLPNHFLTLSKTPINTSQSLSSLIQYTYNHLVSNYHTLLTLTRSHRYIEPTLPWIFGRFEYPSRFTGAWPSSYLYQFMCRDAICEQENRWSSLLHLLTSFLFLCNFTNTTCIQYALLILDFIIVY